MPSDPTALADQLLALANALPEAVLVKDTAGRYLAFNQTASRLAGRPAADVLGRDDHSVFEPETAGRVMERDRRVMESGAAETGEEELVVNGERRTFLASRIPQRDAHGAVVALTTILRDLTDGKRVEAELREGEELYQLLVEGPSDYIRVHDLEGRTVYNSGSVTRLYGRAPTVLFQFAHPEDLERCRHWWQQVVDGGDDRIHWRVRDASGQVRWLETQATRLNYRGQPHIMTLCRDETERREADERLRQRELQLAAAHRLAQVGTWDDDLDADRLVWSDEVSDILGLDRPAQLPDRAALHALVHPDDVARQAEATRRALLGDAPYDIEFRMVRPDGEVRHIHSVGEVVRDETGRPKRAFGLVQDITDRARAEEALRASEARHRLALDVAGIGTFRHEIATGWVELDATAQELLGFDKPLITVEEVTDRMHPEDRDRLMDVAQRSVTESDTGVWVSDCRIVRPSGDVRWLVIRGRVYCEGQGEARHLVLSIGTYFDITDRMRAEEALRRSDALNAAILRGSFDAIILIDHQGKVRGWNPAATRILGYSESQALGQPFVGLVIPASAGDRLALGSEEPHLDQRMELPALRADGSEMPAELTLTRIPIEGQPMFAGYLRDISERKRAESELRETLDRVRLADERLHHVLASSPAVLFTLAIADSDIRGVTWFSHNVTEVFGYPPEAAARTDWWMGHIHPDDRQRVMTRAREDLFATGRSAEEYRFRHQNGSYRWTRSEIRLVHDASGRPLEAVGSWSDLTDRKQLEDQLRQAQKMEAIGHLAGGVAHDFNNLLSVIIGNCDVLMADLPPDEQGRELITEVREAGERAAGLTRQLLAFSRRTMLEPKVIDLNEVVRENERMLRRLIGEDVRLTASLAPVLMPVRVDPGQIGQVLMNLAVNARDAMPTGGTLTIRTSNIELDAAYAQAHREAQPGSYVLLAVSDTGAGMGPEILEHLFEPFFTTKGPRRGTGLGLATVYGIVKQSGGFTVVASEIGHGTTFEIYLRCAAPASRPTGAHRAIQEVTVGGTEIILLVEDDDAVRAVTRRMLQHSGYTVLEAGGGPAAIRIYEQRPGPIDLVITDVVMPDMGGRVLVERLTAIRPGLKVLYVSGYMDDAIVRHGIMQAEVAFLQKPFTMAALATKVRQILDAE